MKVEWDKSKHWYNNHCAICRKELKPEEDRAKGHCIFKNDMELNFLACIPCMKKAMLEEAVKQTKELGKKDAGP